MDKLEEELMYLAVDAKYAIGKLKLMQQDLMAGYITYDHMQQYGKMYIDLYNKYAKVLAKARKLPYKPMTVAYFKR